MTVKPMSRPLAKWVVVQVAEKLHRPVHPESIQDSRVARNASFPGETSAGNKGMSEHV